VPHFRGWSGHCSSGGGGSSVELGAGVRLSQTLCRRPVVFAFAASAIGTGILLGILGWPRPHLTVEFAGLILASILTAAFARQPSRVRDWAVMPASFVINFTSLLLLGPNATMLVATGCTVTEWLSDSKHPTPPWRMLFKTATVLTAVQAAGFTHQALGGSMGHFLWPQQGLPIAAAIAVYCVVKGVLTDLVVPFCMRQMVNRSWTQNILRASANYCIGAGVAVGFVEAIDHRNWQILSVAVVPLYFAYRAYCLHVERLEEESRYHEVIESLDQGMSVLDSSGEITLWDDALERILDCPRERALGSSVVGAVPALGKTELPRAIKEASATRSPRTLLHVGLPAAAGARILQVKILPVPDGLTLLWHDVTERTRAEHAIKRSADRLALAAEGANDGLWEWDLVSDECYFSGRWRAMIGLPAAAGTGSPEEWMDRVHAEDVAGLKAALEAHLSGQADHLELEHRIRHEDGTYRRFLCRGVAMRGAGRRMVRIAGSLTDTNALAAAGAVGHGANSGSAFLDPLTGLCNRAVFVEGLGRRLDVCKERPGTTRFAALYLDLDRFKVVNDSLGHPVGDELLTAVSRRLESCLRQGDALARLGGDEFAILLNDLGDEQQANAIAFRIQEALNAPFSIAGREVFTSASIGIAIGRSHYSNPDEIMRDADTAMYHAKSRGKARHELFDADMHARELDRLGLENDLRHSVKHKDFEVVYQPIVSLASGMCVGFESLVRWTRGGKAVSPVTFIPIAEELGLIEPLGTWILQQACATFADWQRRFPDGGLEFITVNVSSRQLPQQNFMWIVEQALQQSGLKPSNLRLEITETALMDSPHVAATLLRELRDFGVKIYLDDFGTGFSSLSHLHKLPVDALKIDRSFVKSLLLPDRPAIVESILALARTMNTSVVAEGIEDEVQARELERLGCTHAQGFLFSRPLSIQAVETLLVANRPLGPKRVGLLQAAAAIENESENYYSSAPLKWPEELQPTGT
jgi:diguanylate cyclase (GGDEF)-like protein/PAS domain S-box-containing protein